MNRDRRKWNVKHRDGVGPDTPSPIVKRFAGTAARGRALDIAAGRGRNALYLARMGFTVDAVDISDEGLRFMAWKHPSVHPVCVDLNRFDIPEKRYRLIVNIRYLNRRLFPHIARGLCDGGVLIFETFLESDRPANGSPTCRDHLLRANELLHAFLSLHVRYYEEHLSRRRNRPAMVASLVAARQPL